jgi:hypothetical protein
VPRAVFVLAGAMTLMFLLAPSTRFGYFIYPLTLIMWVLVSAVGRRRPAPGAAAGPEEPVASSRTSP